MIVQNGREPFVINDLNQSELTKEMAVTKNFGGGCLIGVPLVFSNGKKFGTLCGMDNKPYDFQPEHIQLFKNMASLITYILELDEATQQIMGLSAPIVPVRKGIAILPIIGKVETNRADVIMRVAMEESQRLELEHLVIDLSGINGIDGKDAATLLDIVKMLDLLGVNTIFTGMRPELAIEAVELNHRLKDVTFRSNLEQALSYLGFSISDR